MPTYVQGPEFFVFGIIITIPEILQVCLFGAWLILFFLPLKINSRADGLTGATYALTLTAIGALLIFAIPEQFSPLKSTTRKNFLILATLGGLSYIKWTYSGLSELSNKKDIKPKNEVSQQVEE